MGGRGANQFRQRQSFDGVGDLAAGEGAVDSSGSGEGVEVVGGVVVEQAGLGEGLELVSMPGWGSGRGVVAGVGVACFDAEGAWGEGVVTGEVLAVGELEAEAVAGVAGGWRGARWDRL